MTSRTISTCCLGDPEPARNHEQYNRVMERILMEVCPYCGSNEVYEGDTEYDGAEMRQIFEGSGCFRPLT